MEYVGIPGRVTPTEIALFEQSFHDTCNGITNNTTTTCQGVEFFVWYKRWISLPVPHSLTTTTTTAHGAAIFFCNKIKKTTFVLYPQQGPLSTNFSFVKNALDVATATTPDSNNRLFRTDDPVVGRSLQDGPPTLTETTAATAAATAAATTNDENIMLQPRSRRYGGSTGKGSKTTHAKKTKSKKQNDEARDDDDDEEEEDNPMDNEACPECLPPTVVDFTLAYDTAIVVAVVVATNQCSFSCPPKCPSGRFRVGTRTGPLQRWCHP